MRENLNFINKTRILPCLILISFLAFVKSENQIDCNFTNLLGPIDQNEEQLIHKEIIIYFDSYQEIEHHFQNFIKHFKESNLCHFDNESQSDNFGKQQNQVRLTNIRLQKSQRNSILLSDFIVVELLFSPNGEIKFDEKAKETTEHNLLGDQQQKMEVQQLLKKYIQQIQTQKRVIRVCENKKFKSELYSTKEEIPENEGRNLKSVVGQKLSEIFDLEKYHKQNIKGKGVKIAIFDSGLSEVFSLGQDRADGDFLKVKKIINFSHDKSSKDSLGHGTFISGVVGSLNKECPGIAPEAEIYVLKLFTAERVSYTSWFLDAFNFVLQNGIDIVNLSNGSSDFLDIPFIEKINELTANGVIIVSAIGNEGPFQGTLNNPGDLINVIGIGSLDYSQSNVAAFSSRGMTTWSILDGVGNMKPDLITAGSMILGLGITKENECVSNSGTSVSASVITASIALTLSAFENQEERRKIQNTAFIKQAIIRTARRLKNLSITEQGAGVFDLDSFFNIIVNNQNRQKALIYPQKIDLRKNQTYYLPFSRQSIYSTMMPLSFNLTLINHISLQSTILQTAYDFVVDDSEQIDSLHKCMKFKFEYPKMIWPYFGNLRIQVETDDDFECQQLLINNVELRISFILRNLQSQANQSSRRNMDMSNIEQVIFKLIFDFIPTPPREQRILIDQYHSLKYPENGYILRDSLLNSNYPYEWNGDHIFTNYVQLHQKLVESGFYVEILSENFNCFDSDNYKVLMIIDPEDFFSESEIQKLRHDVEYNSLSLVIFADWYNQDLMKRNKFFNNNTFEVWTPFMAGSNVPSLNALLRPYHIAFGEKVFSGEVFLEKRQVMIDSGTEIIQFPKDGYLLSAKLSEESNQVLAQGLIFEESFYQTKVDLSIDNNEKLVPTIGIVERLNNFNYSGRIVIMTDSSCIDSASPSMTKCFWLIDRFVKIAVGDIKKDPSLMSNKYLLPKDYQSNERPLYSVYEDLDLEQIGALYKQSHLNSQNKQCKNKQEQSQNQRNTYVPFEHQQSEEVVYEWTASPDSPDLDNQVFLIRWFRLSVSSSIQLLDNLVQNGQIFPLLVVILLLISVGTYLLKHYIFNKHPVQKKNGKKFWILRRDANSIEDLNQNSNNRSQYNYYDQPNFSGIDSETSSSICSEDEFIYQGHQERYNDL